MRVDACTLIRRLHEHRAWVNEKLIRAAKSIDDRRLRQSFDIGQGSIWRTLLHLYAAEFVWLEALEGNEDPLAPGDLPGKIPGNQEGEGSIADLSELGARWSELQGRWRDYLGSLTDERLAGVVHKKSTSSGAGKRLPANRVDVLMHVCTHAQYTTAQLVNMLKRVEADELPDVMLISLARSQAGTI